MSQSTLAKIIIQQCVSARLQTKPPENDVDAEFVEIGRGIVVYVCFMKGATEATVEKVFNMVTSVKLSRDSDGKLKSVVDINGDILVVPQATLGGKLKGKTMQYHNNIDKQLGYELYEKLIPLLCNAVGKTSSSQVKHGTYGNLQVLNIDTNGPYTHTMDII